MKRIDPENWEGREMFAQFSAMECPFFSVTTRYDATALLEKARTIGASFSSVCLFAVSKALNEVEAFRYRVLEGGDIVLYDKIDTVYLARRKTGPSRRFACRFRLIMWRLKRARRQEEAKTPGFARSIFLPWI